MIEGLSLAPGPNGQGGVGAAELGDITKRLAPCWFVLRDVHSTKGPFIARLMSYFASVERPPEWRPGRCEAGRVGIEPKAEYVAAMLNSRPRFLAMSLVLGGLSTAGCGDDDGPGPSPAQARGVGVECAGSSDCADLGLVCLPFKGGYCGLEDCMSNGDCPLGSACVDHSDGNAYCFLICTDKPQCNYYRSPDAEANCSSNITWVEDPGAGVKACVPPS